jgi:hypothetical protein
MMKTCIEHDWKVTPVIMGIKRLVCKNCRAVRS